MGQNRPRGVWRSLFPSLVTGLCLFVGYFTLPFTSRLTANTVLLLTAGLLAVGVLLVWQVRAILTSPMPVARSLGTITVTLPLFLVVFSITYFLMSRATPSAFTEDLSRLDALYFTLVTFATVGFGDITPVSETARALVTVQIAGNLLIVGVVARIVVNAVNEGFARRVPHERDADPRDEDRRVDGRRDDRD
jgi:hypothetical protein